MATSYAQLQKQIDELQAQAQRQKQSEIANVIAGAREAIRVYGLTLADLFGTSTSSGKAAASKGKPINARVSGDGAKYADGKGGTWVGRGPRPQWLRDALGSGHSLEEFALDASASTPTSQAAAKPAKKASKKGSRAGQIRFRDAEGNQWSGFGRKPAWFTAAIAAGKTADDLAV